MKTIKKALKASGNFISAHKIAIAVIVTAAAGVAVNRSAVSDWKGFLEEKDLTDEYETYLRSW